MGLLDHVKDRTYLLDIINALNIENGDLTRERDRYQGALEDIRDADETSTLEGAVAIARAALEKTNE